MTERLVVSFRATPHTYQLRSGQFHVPKSIMKKSRKWRFMAELTRTCEVGSTVREKDIIGFEVHDATPYLNVMQVAAENVFAMIKEADDEESAHFNDGQRYCGWVLVEWQLWML